MCFSEILMEIQKLSLNKLEMSIPMRLLIIFFYSQNFLHKEAKNIFFYSYRIFTNGKNITQKR